MTDRDPFWDALKAHKKEKFMFKGKVQRGDVIAFIKKQS